MRKINLILFILFAGLSAQATSLQCANLFTKNPIIERLQNLIALHSDIANERFANEDQKKQAVYQFNLEIDGINKINPHYIVLFKEMLKRQKNTSTQSRESEVQKKRDEQQVRTKIVNNQTIFQPQRVFKIEDIKTAPESSMHSVTSTLTSPDQKSMLVTVTKENNLNEKQIHGEVQKIDLQTGKIIFTAQVDFESYSIITPDQKFFIVINKELGKASAFDFSTGQKIHEYFDNEHVFDAIITGDSRYLVTTSWSTLTVTEIANGKVIYQKPFPDQQYIQGNSLAFTSDYKAFAVSYANSVEIYDFATGAKKYDTITLHAPASKILISSDDKYLLIDSISIQIYSLATGKPASSKIKTEFGTLNKVLNQNYLVNWKSPTSYSVHDISSGKELFTTDLSESLADKSASFSLDGRYLAWRGKNPRKGVITVQDLVTQQILYQNEEGICRGFHLTPDAKFLIMLVDAGNKIKVVELANTNNVVELSPQTAARFIQVLSDSNTFMAGGPEGAEVFKLNLSNDDKLLLKQSGH